MYLISSLIDRIHKIDFKNCNQEAEEPASPLLYFGV